MSSKTTLSLIASGLFLQLPTMAAKAKLYDLETGKSVVLEFKNKWLSGHGPIKGTMPDGTVIEGEFRTIVDPKSGRQHGSAVATGKDLVLDCDYEVNGASHGIGSCSDNHGKRYKLIF